MRSTDRILQRGFTLVELVVAMAVLALLAFAVMPSVSDWIVTTRVRNAAESIQNGMQKARNEALRRNKNVTFWLVSQSDQRIVDNGCAQSSSSGSWVVSLAAPDGLCGTTPSTTVSPMIVDTHAAGDGGTDVTVAAVDATNAASTSITFNGFGQAMATGTSGTAPIGTVDLTSTSGGRRLRIQVSTGGGVRLCDRDIASPDPRACVSAS